MKSILSLYLLFGLLMFSTCVAHADGECPEGMFPTNPAGAQGPVGCAPIPGYDQQQAQQQTPQPPPQWTTHWGAIATDEPHGVLGTATDMSSKNQAQQGAIADCQAKGGTRCKLEIAYDNECAALIVSKTGYVVTTDTIVDKAVQSGMKTCTNAGYLNCHAGYTACSLPQRIQ